MRLDVLIKKETCEVEPNYGDIFTINSIQACLYNSKKGDSLEKYIVVYEIDGDYGGISSFPFGDEAKEFRPGETYFKNSKGKYLPYTQ